MSAQRRVFSSTCHHFVTSSSLILTPPSLLPPSSLTPPSLLGTDAISSLAEIRAREEVASQRAQVVTDMLSDLAVYLSQRMRIEATERATRQATRQAATQAMEQAMERTTRQATRQTATPRSAATAGGGERVSALAPLALEIEAAVSVDVAYSCRVWGFI